MQRLKLLSIVLFPTFFFLFTAPTLHADDAEWRKVCRYIESANYRPDQAVTVRDKQLLLVNADSGDVITHLDSGFESFYGQNIFWTENCRYVVALNVWMPNDFYEYPVRTTSMYDTFTGQRILRWGRDEFLDFRYSPSKEQFYMRTSTGGYLMSERMAEPVELNPIVYIKRWNVRTLRQSGWDMEREEFVVVFHSNSGYVQVYDFWTGAQRAAISHPSGCQSPVDFSYSEDNRYILVYSAHGDSFSNACVTVYNRDDGSVRSVPAGDATGATRDAIALSPDGRYLVVGWHALRVWDLHTLSADFATREPIHRHEGPLKVIREVRFVDNTTVETTSFEGVQRWNILTGEQIQDF